MLALLLQQQHSSSKLPAFSFCPEDAPLLQHLLLLLLLMLQLPSKLLLLQSQPLPQSLNYEFLLLL